LSIVVLCGALALVLMSLCVSLQGSFEVVMKRQHEGQEEDGALLFSKLDTFGPAKNRAHLPALLDVLELVKAQLGLGTTPPGSDETERKEEEEPTSGTNKRKRTIARKGEDEEKEKEDEEKEKPASKPKRVAKRTRREPAVAN
jgi:hypothetical protein